MMTDLFASADWLKVENNHGPCAKNGASAEV